MKSFRLTDTQRRSAVETAAECADFDYRPMLVEPDTSLRAIASHDGPVIIDFDETLYLRNSSEDFLDCLAPAFAGFLLLRTMGLFKPWRLTGEQTRDAWRLRAAALAFPWIWRSWRASAPERARAHTNEALREALLLRPDAVVATLGFEPVVAPLLEEMGLGHLRLVACRFGSIGDRRRGKLALLRDALGEEAVARSLVVTDSPYDGPLLAACGKPMFVLWPEAQFVPALGRVRKRLRALLGR